MNFRRVCFYTTLVFCAVAWLGNGCGSGKASVFDAAHSSDGPTSTGGVASGGISGTGGVASGGISGTGGVAGGGGAGGMANGGAGGSGGAPSSGGTSVLAGNRDSGLVDAPATGIADGNSLDRAVEDGASPHCVGVPSNSSCPASESGCSSVMGCSLRVPTTGHCNGNARPCTDNKTTATCAAEPGCLWSVDGGSSAACGGIPAGCSYDTPSDRCQASGCMYMTNGPYCGGTPTACTQLSTTDCGKQLGCTLGSD
jgi:hypothetical protein